MRLRFGIALNLAVIACLSSLILGMGTGTSISTVIVFLAAALSLYFTDLLGFIRLKPIISNILILGIVGINVWGLFRYPTSELAIGIAMILQYVQVVILFQEKKARNRWHIILLSFLQVVVATVFQQSLGFAILLLFYVFANLCALSLIFLNEENQYYQKNSAARGLFHLNSQELFAKQDWWRLVKIVLTTFSVGPLSLIMSYRETKEEKTDSSSAEQNSKFLDNLESLDNAENGVAVKARFSVGTDKKTGIIGKQWELYRRLAIATLFSLLVGTVIFLVTPRLGGSSVIGEFPNSGQWRANSVSTVSSVGFTEEVRLGSLGNVQQNFEEVLSITFSTQGINATTPGNDIYRLLKNEPKPYEPITFNEVYLRGVVVDKYDYGKWSKQPESSGYFGSNSVFRDQRNNSFISRTRIFREQSIPEMFFENDCDLVNMEVTTQPLDSNVLFIVWPFYIDEEVRSKVSIDQSRISLNNNQPLRDPCTFLYYTTAFRNGVQLDIVPNNERINFFALLQIPHNRLPNLINLAQKWDEESNLHKEDYIGRARYIAEQLKTSGQFTYKLGNTTRDLNLDPLEDFVSKNPQGHCEYFAGTLAMMLRAVEIPARVCIGYKIQAQRNEECKQTVRQSDAHSWVEVFIPEASLNKAGITGFARNEKFAFKWTQGGWLRLDATPEAVESSGLKGFSISLTDINRLIQNFWRSNVLNMNPSRQTELVYKPLTETFEIVKKNLFHPELWKDTASLVLHRYKTLFEQFQGGTWTQSDIVLIVIPLAVCLSGFYTLARFGFLRLLRNLITQISPTHYRQQAAIEFYLSLERLLAKIEFRRHPVETQHEFVTRAAAGIFEKLYRMTNQGYVFSDDEVSGSVNFSTIDDKFTQIVDSYYKIRFGNEALSAAELEQIEEDLKFLKTAVEFLAGEQSAKKY
ncbi:MAG: transglutaminaseTgpA domain-containing protein [Thermoguttaceae bacterium]